MTVYDQRRGWKLGPQDRFQSVIHVGEWSVTEAVLWVGWRKPTGQQYLILLPQWNFELVAEAKEHAAGGVGTSSFDVAEVSR